MTSRSIIYRNLHKPNNKLVNARTSHGQTRTHKIHHGPYNILCAWPHGMHPNVILYRDSQVGRPEILEIRTPTTLEAHNLLCKPSIEVRFKTKL